MRGLWLSFCPLAASAPSFPVRAVAFAFLVRIDLIVRRISFCREAQLSRGADPTTLDAPADVAVASARARNNLVDLVVNSPDQAILLYRWLPRRFDPESRQNDKARCCHPEGRSGYRLHGTLTVRRVRVRAQSIVRICALSAPRLAMSWTVRSWVRTLGGRRRWHGLAAGDAVAGLFQEALSAL